jgi:chromosome segregation ATPase
MYRSCLLILSLLLISGPIFGQSASTDSQTLPALLAEVRELRHDLQTITVAAQRAQIVLYQLQGQEVIVARALQRLDDARARLTEIQASRIRLTSDIKQHEDFVSHTENPSGERKQIEDLLPRLKANLALLENDEQQSQTKEMEAEDQLRVERAKLSGLQGQLDRLEKPLESSSQQAGANPH